MFLFLPPFHHPRHLKSGVHPRGHVGRRVYFTTFTNFLSEMNKRYSGILITNLCITKLGIMNIFLYPSDTLLWQQLQSAPCRGVQLYLLMQPRGVQQVQLCSMIYYHHHYHRHDYVYYYFSLSMLSVCACLYHRDLINF